MRTGTIVSLGASAVLGLGALIVARVWLPQSSHGPAPKAGPAVIQATVPVVVATGDLAYGAKLDASHLMVEQLPPGDAPKGAFSSPSQLLSQTGGPPVVLTPIAAHEPVLAAKLSTGGARAIVSAAIAEGMRGYTIPITDVGGVGGHAMPNDHVDVIVSRDIPQINLPNLPSCNCKRVRADVVLQNVRVLGIDLNADPSSTQAAFGRTATLEVTVQDAQKLAVAAQTGTLSLALRRVGSAEITPVRTVEIGDLRSTAPRAPGPTSPPDDARLIDVMRHSAPRAFPAPSQAAPRTHSVIVVHGDNPTSVDVPAERFGAGA
jgi:pilus assembly protein CpaB